MGPNWLSVRAMSCHGWHGTPKVWTTHKSQNQKVTTGLPHRYDIKPCGCTNPERIGCSGLCANPSSFALVCCHHSGLYRLEISCAYGHAGKTLDSQGTPLMKLASLHYRGTGTSDFVQYRRHQALTQDQGGEKQEPGTPPLPKFLTMATPGKGSSNRRGKKAFKHVLQNKKQSYISSMNSIFAVKFTSPSCHHCFKRKLSIQKLTSSSFPSALEQLWVATTNT